MCFFTVFTNHRIRPAKKKTKSKLKIDIYIKINLQT